MSSFTIGGIDLIMQGPKTSAPLRTILEMSHDLWPDSIFQDADEESTRPVRELLAAKKVPKSSEFFIYKDNVNANSWSKRGMTATNNTNMLHFLLVEDPERTDLLQITAVIGELTPEMAMFCGRLSFRLKQLLPAARRHSSRQSPIKLTTELRNAGCNLSPDKFLTLLEGLRLGLYSEWTQDELACHPQEALVFCEEVRKQTRARIPDRVIMKAMLNRRKRSQV